MGTMKLKVWTIRPSALLREVMLLHGLALAEADELVKHSRFNGLFVIFLRLSEAQFCILEDAAVRLSLRYDGNQQADYTHLFDTRWYPPGTAYDKGMHDAEVNMWHFKTLAYPRQYGLLGRNPRRVQENSPQEAIANSVLHIRQVLDELRSIPAKQRSPEAEATIAHNEGYLERVRQEFSHF